METMNWCYGYYKESFVSLEGLNNHVKEVHIDSEKLQCDQCDRKFIFKRNLTQHKKIKHSGLFFDCGKCRKKFASKFNLRRHKQTCLKCYKCGKQMSTIGELASYSCAASKKTVKFKCDSCGKEFDRKTDCLRHKHTSCANGRESNASGENSTSNANTKNRFASTHCPLLRGDVSVGSDFRLNNGNCEVSGNTLQV